MPHQVAISKHSSGSQFAAVQKDLARVLELVRGNAEELAAMRYENATLLQTCMELRIEIATLTKRLESIESCVVVSR
jgi:hypothetical protein